MKKKALLLTSIGAVFLVGISAVAISGIGQLNKLNTPVKASPTEYSVTFDASDESKTTIETFDDDLAICTTTAAGNKVGVMGFDKTAEFGLSFRGFKCHGLFFFDDGTLEEAGAYDFGHITGFTVVFGCHELRFEWEDENSEIHDEYLEESGARFNVTCTPHNHPMFWGEATISSLTVHYTC